MKPILFFGASVSAAAISFAFAVLADHAMSRSSPEAKVRPSLYNPDRNRDALRLIAAREVPRIMSAPIVTQPEIATKPAPQADPDTLTGVFLRRPVPKPLHLGSGDLSEATRLTAVQAHSTAIAESGPAFDAAPSLVSRFLNLPQIGVYR
ncbi:hypothetical protein FQV27_04925 [Paracoccus aurantiacus]|uniref:Energy transducer TonB n=1 Tax=Paracoccus aurantiacus TaxID=2599412 RepID=A0A5C6S9X0_9RHOB|nr:hypothetical protein [Paracoccus aurantiacus]TXB71190.1 hypothetical protein FQV27_04925 [Paracoccus aurantiacus]